MENMKVAIVTCYKQPDYVRSVTLRQAVAAQKDTESIVIKNSHTGMLRYPEVLWKLLKVRFGQKPDVYVITFRAYELLPFLLLIAGRKPILYDEFINPILVVREHQSQKTGLVKSLMSSWQFFGKFYYWLIRGCRFILTDTQAHAEYSAALSGIKLEKYKALPVSTDESLFKPTEAKDHGTAFRVFFYGNMVPLHGLTYIVETSRLLRSYPDIEFLLVGGDDKAKRLVAQAKADGANIRHRKWVPFDQLPALINEADVCLGGPFGGTTQSDVVVTGKSYQFLASAKATVIGRATATTEHFKDKENCLLVDQANPPALADALVWAYRHRRQLPTIGKHGWQTYEQYFSNQALGKQVGAILDQLR